MNTFVTSDIHLNHRNIQLYCPSRQVIPVSQWDEDGKAVVTDKMVSAMNERIISNWNAKVSQEDTVYILGDVAMGQIEKAPALISRLNGKKILIKGNHDIFKLSDYTKYFRDIRSYHVMNGMILSHIPISKDSIARFGTNIHGHTHGNRVRKPRGVDAKTGQILYSDQIDPDYFCVCV